MVLAGLWASSSASIAQDIYRNPANESPTLPDLIDFAAWSESERTGMDIDVIGTTTEHCVANAITFRAYTYQEWHNEGLPFKGAVTANCNGGYIIVAHPLFPAKRGLLLHELQHALGVWRHLPDLYAVGSEITSGSYLMTTTDALAVIEDAAWPLYREPSLCHNELAPDMDLMIPDVGGYEALLDYTPLIADGAVQEHRWTKVYSRPQPHPQDCTNNIMYPNGDVDLTDIRGMEGTYESAEFEYMGGDMWRLVGVVAGGAL